MLGITPNGITGFVTTAPDLDSGEVGLGNAIETGSFALCADAMGSLFAGSRDSAVLTRYDLRSDGVLAPSDQVSFANEGVTQFSGFSRQFVFRSNTEALYVDRTTGIVVVWDPSSMTVQRSFRITGFETEGTRATLRPAQTTQRDDLLIYVRYVSTADNLFTDESSLVSVNLETDESTVFRDDRCGGLISDVETAEGTVYFSSVTAVAAYDPLGVGSPGQEPCILRVRPAETEFDPDYIVRTNTLSGMPAGGLFPSGDSGALFYAFDSDLVDPSEFAEPDDYIDSLGWRTFEIADLASASSSNTRLVEALAPRVGRLPEALPIEDRVYLSEAPPDFSRSSLLNITDPFAPFTGLTAEGAVMISVHRLRPRTGSAFARLRLTGGERPAKLGSSIARGNTGATDWTKRELFRLSLVETPYALRN